MSLPASALRTEAVTARKEARLELRRMRLLGAALDLFAERGYEETSVGAIVARARMSKSAFYEHLKTKEHCFREVLLAEGGERIRDVLPEAATGHGHHQPPAFCCPRF